jgi:hypothetical protein
LGQVVKRLMGSSQPSPSSWTNSPLLTYSSPAIVLLMFILPLLFVIFVSVWSFWVETNLYIVSLNIYCRWK